MTTRQQWQLTVGLVLFLGGMSLTGWLVDFTWLERLGVAMLLLGANVSSAVARQLRDVV